MIDALPLAAQFSLAKFSMLVDQLSKEDLALVLKRSYSFALTCKEINRQVIVKTLKA